LNNNSLSGDAFLSEKGFLNKTIVVEQSSHAVVDTEASRLGSAVNTTLRDEFASCATFSVDVRLAVHVYVGVFNPGHNLLVCSEIGAKAVDLGANETLFGELHSVSTSNLFDFTLGVLLGVNLNATFSATEGNICDGELEGHQRSERHDFLQVHVGRITGSALDRKLVMLVLGTVANDALDGAVVSADGNRETNDIIAGADQLEVVF
jgi:hypothetical protein